MEKEHIIKVLGCCTEQEVCGTCPFEGKCGGMEYLLENALTLIREQEKKIEELEKEAAFLEREADNAVSIAEGNIRAEIASGGTSCHWCENKIKADTVRKMQELLCKGRVSNDPVVTAVNVAAKQLTEEKQSE